MLYDLIPHAPHPSNDPSRPALETHVDGMVGFVTKKTAPSPTQTSEVNAVQSTSSQQPGGKKKNKGKSKNSSNPQESTKTVDTQPKGKLKFPCMICAEDHYTKDFPHREEVTKFLKGTSQPAVLTNPFLIQQQQMVAQNPAPPQGGNAGHPHHEDASSSTAQVLMCNGIVSLTTRAKTYDTPPDNHANGGATDNPSTSTPPPSSTPLQIERHVVDSVLHPPKGTIQSQFSIQVPVLLKTTTLLNIWQSTLCYVDT
jgi:hypothetical protein